MFQPDERRMVPVVGVFPSALTLNKRKVNMTTENTLVKNIEGKSKADAMDILVPEIGYKKAEEFWKEHGAGRKQRGFRAMFYKELEKKDMTKDQVKAYCEKNGSENDAKQYTHYVAIADLVRVARAK